MMDDAGNDNDNDNDADDDDGNQRANQQPPVRGGPCQALTHLSLSSLFSLAQWRSPAAAAAAGGIPPGARAGECAPCRLRAVLTLLDRLMRDQRKEERRKKQEQEEEEEIDDDDDDGRQRVSFIVSCSAQLLTSSLCEGCSFPSV